MPQFSVSFETSYMPPRFGDTNTSNGPPPKMRIFRCVFAEDADFAVDQALFELSRSKFTECNGVKVEIVGTPRLISVDEMT